MLWGFVELMSAPNWYLCLLDNEFSPCWIMRLHVLVVFLCVTACIGCSRYGAGGEAEQVDLQDLPDQETWTAELRLSENGIPAMILAAPYMARYENPDTSYSVFTIDPGLEDSSRVRVQLFDASGQISASMAVDRLVYLGAQDRFEGSGSVYAVLHRADNAEVRADSLRYSEQEQEQEFVVFGNVFVTTADGRQLATERLVWSAGNQRITTTGFFEMTSARERIQGYELVATEDLTRYTFSSASGEFEVDE